MEYLLVRDSALYALSKYIYYVKGFWSSYTANPTATHTDARVRSVLGPLAKIAKENEIAVAGICHLNKSQQKNTLYKPGGSSAHLAETASPVAAGSA